MPSDTPFTPGVKMWGSDIKFWSQSHGEVREHFITVIGFVKDASNSGKLN